jgi:hypothetical protein
MKYSYNHARLCEVYLITYPYTIYLTCQMVTLYLFSKEDCDSVRILPVNNKPITFTKSADYSTICKGVIAFLLDDPNHFKETIETFERVKGVLHFYVTTDK